LFASRCLLRQLDDRLSAPRVARGHEPSSSVRRTSSGPGLSLHRSPPWLGDLEGNLSWLPLAVWRLVSHAQRRRSWHSLAYPLEPTAFAGPNTAWARPRWSLGDRKAGPAGSGRRPSALAHDRRWYDMARGMAEPRYRCQGKGPPRLRPAS